MKTKEQDIIWKRICPLLFSYKRYFPGISICLICTSVMTFLQPLIIRKITDQGMMQKDMECILIFSGALMFVAALSHIAELIQTKLFADIHNSLTLSLYRKAYMKMAILPIAYYDEKGTAEIVNTVNTDIENMASITDQITTFSVSAILQIVGGIVGLSILDWKLALLITLLIPVKYLIVYRFAKKKNLAFEKSIENNRKFCAWIGDCVAGIREMKLWGLFDIRVRHFEHLQKEMMDSYKKNMLLDQYRTLCVSALDMLMNASLYVLSGFLIVKGQFTVGGAFAFITYSNYVVNPISFLINIKYYFAQIKPSAKRFFAFLDQPKETCGSKKADVSADTGNKPVLQFTNVSFRYGKEKMILKDVNLSVHQGEQIGIIGENGSGKSTIINLILGFYQLGHGQIRIDGIPLEDIGIENIRKRIAVVSQKPYFFYGTIADNINIDGTASFEEITKACMKSGAATFIEKLENGYQQTIGQNGVKLSGGEKQKLAIARALLKKADILIMDEATAGFDVESNQSFIPLLSGAFETKTIIFITHRYEDLKNMERVYRLSDGKLEEQI